MLKTHTWTFDEIIAGKRTGFTLPDTDTFYKDIAEPIRCADGTKVSVQASHMHYCKPRDDIGPYTHVEVGYPDVDPPESWAEYGDGDYPSSVYGYVPVELVREYIAAHGGEQKAGGGATTSGQSVGTG